MIILHDSDGRPYYEAIEFYCKNNNIQLEYYENHVFIPTIKNMIKILIGRKPNWYLTKRIFRNFIFRLKVPFIRNKTIILGFAPYNFRIIWYKILLKNNNLIYHTSYPDWINEDRVPLKYGILEKIFKKIWQNFLEKQSLKVVCVTKQSEISLQKAYKVKHVYQIYHTIDFNRYQKYYKHKNEKLKILFVGKLIYQKGLETIIEIINNLPSNEYEFTIVGDGEYRKKIEYIFQKKNVNYLGWIDDKDELAKIYAGHDVFLNPSIKISGWQELFGVVNIEAMAAGLVVIASNHVGPREIITHDINGFLVEEKKSLDIIKILEQLKNDENKLFQISTEAKKRAKDFNINVIAKKWENIINEK